MGPGGEWLTGWASAKPFPGKDTRTLTSDRVVFSRYNLGRHLRGSQVPQKKCKARLNVQFPRLDALLVSAVIRVNAEGRKLTLKGLILRKQAQALLLVLTHPAPNHLLRKLKPSTFHRAEEWPPCTALPWTHRNLWLQSPSSFHYVNHPVGKKKKKIHQPLRCLSHFILLFVRACQGASVMSNSFQPQGL